MNYELTDYKYLIQNLNTKRGACVYTALKDTRALDAEFDRLTRAICAM